MKTGHSIRNICTTTNDSAEDSFPYQNFVYIASTKNSIHSLDLSIILQQGDRKVQATTLVDSGAYSCFIHYQFVKDKGLRTRKLNREIRVFNADVAFRTGAGCTAV